MTSLCLTGSPEKVSAAGAHVLAAVVVEAALARTVAHRTLRLGHLDKTFENQFVNCRRTVVSVTVTNGDKALTELF